MVRPCGVRAIWLLWLLPALVRGAGDVPFGQGLLFLVQSGSGARSHLFATVHSDDSRVLELPSAVRQAFDAAHTFAMEILPDSAALLTSMITMVLTDGRTLEDVVGTERYRRAVRAVAARGLAESSIREFKPWAVATLLSLPPAAESEILDIQLYRLAKEQGKQLRGLERIDEQLALFDGLSEADQIAWLEQTLGFQDQLPAFFEQLLVTYLRRDLAGLAELSDRHLAVGDKAMTQRFTERAVTRRNRLMVERMQPLLEAGGAIVAVGALHLPGEQGILALLQRAGFAVQRVY
jgi:uncharacterized protein YbaP (TraB family)